MTKQGERQRGLRAAQRVVVKVGISIVTGTDGEVALSTLSRCCAR